MATKKWKCPRCGLKREIEVTHEGAGVPACPTDQTALVPDEPPAPPMAAFPGSDRFDEIFAPAEYPRLPGLAKALEARDPELAQEVPLDD